MSHAEGRLVGGRYQLVAPIGRGGMGIVWRAEDRMMGRHVAVKELHLPDGLGPDDRRLFRERLLREGVIVRPLHGFGAPTAIRVSVGTPDENEVFAEALGRALQPGVAAPA